MVSFWKLTPQVSTKDPTFQNGANIKSTRAWTCTRAPIDITKHLIGHYRRGWCEKIGSDMLVSPLTSSLFPSLHTHSFRLVHRLMPLLDGATTYWNILELNMSWLELPKSLQVVMVRHPTLPPNASLLQSWTCHCHRITQCNNSK